MVDLGWGLPEMPNYEFDFMVKPAPAANPGAGNEI